MILNRLSDDAIDKKLIKAHEHLKLGINNNTYDAFINGNVTAESNLVIVELLTRLLEKDQKAETKTITTYIDYVVPYGLDIKIINALDVADAIIRAGTIAPGEDAIEQQNRIIIFIKYSQEIRNELANREKAKRG